MRSDSSFVLTADELSFLRDYGLTSTDVFDGRRHRIAVAKAMAKAAGQSVILGTPCLKSGHRLRTRANHCVQCDPKKLAFQRRHSADGYVYVLGSKKTRLFKVGQTNNTNGDLI